MKVPKPQQKYKSYDAYLDFVWSWMLIEDKLVAFLFKLVELFFLDFQLTHANLWKKKKIL
jgi:hypothetical protein